MTEVEKIIRKHYNPRFTRLGWETCGEAIYRLISDKQDNLKETKRYKNAPTYAEECRMLDDVHNKIENEYESYFEFGPGCYDWINGNDNLKELLVQ